MLSEKGAGDIEDLCRTKLGEGGKRTDLIVARPSQRLGHGHPDAFQMDQRVEVFRHATSGWPKTS